VLEVGEDHIEHAHVAFDQLLRAVALVERVAASGGHDADGHAGVDQPPGDEVGDGQVLFRLGQKGAAADFPDIPVPFDYREIVGAFASSRFGLPLGHRGRNRSGRSQRAGA
jgi:hypothetical protein